jgi:hypothetical protein
MMAKYAKLLAGALLAVGGLAQATTMADKPMAADGMKDGQRKEMMMDGKKAAKPPMDKKAGKKMGEEPMEKPADGKAKM